MTFDLEKLLAMAVSCSNICPGGREEEEEEEGKEEDEGRDLGNASLRRKLFGQPERQVSIVSVMDL